MATTKHGISIGINRIDDRFVIAIKATGKLTHADYEFMTPLLEEALKEVRDPSVKVLFDGTEFEGWEARAAWDDLKLGLKHGNDFSRIAFIGNKQWEKVAAKVGSWFMNGEMKYFEDHDEAVNWLAE